MPICIGWLYYCGPTLGWPSAAFCKVRPSSAGFGRRAQAVRDKVSFRLLIRDLKRFECHYSPPTMWLGWRGWRLHPSTVWLPITLRAGERTRKGSEIMTHPVCVGAIHRPATLSMNIEQICNGPTTPNACLTKSVFFCPSPEKARCVYARPIGSPYKCFWLNVSVLS